MLSDPQLMKLSLLLAVIGIIALFFIVQSIEPKQVEISEITNSLVGQYVIVNGKVSNIYNNGGNLFIDLTDDNNEIKVIMFQKDAKNLDAKLEQDDKVKVTGKVSFYKNELEIIASSIERL